MSGPIRGFGPSELQGGDDQPTAAELADAFAAARSLEAYTRSDEVRPTADFEDRVMAAIAREPAPRVVFGARAAGRSGLAGVVAAFTGAVRDAWGVALGGGRPLAVRAQALEFLLLVGVLATSLTGVTAAGVGALLNTNQEPTPTVPAPTVTPSVVAPSPSVAPSPIASPSPSPSPTASPSPTQTASPSPTTSPRATETAEPTGTDDPSETPEATGTSGTDDSPDASDDNSGPGGGGSGDD